MDLHWRNTMKTARFLFNTDARSALFLLFFLVHMRLWSLGMCIGVMALFYVLEQRGLSFDSALRAFRWWLLGNHRPRTLRVYQPRYVDFG